MIINRRVIMRPSGREMERKEQEEKKNKEKRRGEKEKTKQKHRVLEK